MTFRPISLKGAYVIDLEPFNDDRGWFARFYCKDEFKQIGHDAEWVQLNQSVTYKSGSVRGMHFQRPPFSEIKMVRCISGAVFDVIVDIRKSSETFLQWFGIELSAENRKMLYIPEGFAHGFQTLSENAALIYHHSAIYAPGSEGGIRFDDPALSIKWPLPIGSVSQRDMGHPYVDSNFKGI